MMLTYIVLNFVTGYYKKGNVVMRRGPIIRHYLRTWFIFDFIATIPFTWFIADRDVDYWPDDDFDETAAIENGISLVRYNHLPHQFLETDRLVATLSDFDLA